MEAIELNSGQFHKDSVPHVHFGLCRLITVGRFGYYVGQWRLSSKATEVYECF